MGTELKYEYKSVPVFTSNIWDYCRVKKFLVSVIVNTCDGRMDVFEETMWDICRQKTDFEFEIIIIDDASTDGVEELLINKYSNIINEKRLKYIKICTRLGFCKPIYIGAAAADGEFILFQGSGIVQLHDNGFQKIINALDEETIAVFATECRHLGTKRFDYVSYWRDHHEELLNLHYKSYAGNSSESWFLLGAIRWKDFQEKTIFRAPCVDSRLSLHIRRDGRKIKFVENTICFHLTHTLSAIGGIPQHWWTVNGGNPP
jgi:glycosyltransferase involved in cell wall biosynthesis